MTYGVTAIRLVISISVVMTLFSTEVASTSQNPVKPQIGTEEPNIVIENAYQPRQILIKFKKAALTPKGKSAPENRKPVTPGEMPDVSKLLKKHGLKRGHAVFKNAFDKSRPKQKNLLNAKQQLELEDKKEGLSRWYNYKTNEGVDLKKLLKKIKKENVVEKAELNYHWKMHWGFDPPIENLPDGTTDPLIPDQWYLTNAHVQQAWNYINTNGVCGGGNSDVVIAVIDSGVDYNHEDLQASMWVNTAEIPGNGLDDDDNGFIDDIHGCNVVSDSRSHTGDPMDLHGHGTHVAGIIAAQAFNEKGIAGVAFNTKIMAIRAAQYTGILTIQDVAEGIIYATENGAEVINMSFGGYQYSLVVEDALQVALNQAVLVAAAGNDSRHSVLQPPPSYPASLPYVIGVMASDIENKPCWFSNSGPHYNIFAPGESIMSTLPGNRYAKWSGTSMATPVVSGIAGLMRSFFWQRDIYSNRFLMASITGSGSVVDAYIALTTPPTPGVTMYENWIFDDDGIAEQNDGDGSIDSGETIHLAIELINRSGAAEDVNLTLRARTQGSMIDDPYVEIIKGTSYVPAMGPWSMYDNGLIYSAEGVIVGVDDPLIFKIDPNCPNEHVIPMELTITFEDGWDPNSTGTFTRISRWNYVVTRGKNIPRVIDEDMTLTSDEYWIVNGPTLIDTGATLTITEGTQIQFGAISDDPYNPGPQNGNFVVRGNLEIEGTADRPVNMFPSYLVSGQTVDISFDGGYSGGTGNMKYATIRNPKIGWGFHTIDHCYFEQDYGVPIINAEEIGYSIFYKLRPEGAMISNYYDTCCFSAGWTLPTLTAGRYRGQFRNNVFMQDNENKKVIHIRPDYTFQAQIFKEAYAVLEAEYDADKDITYVLHKTSSGNLNISTAEIFANYFGGHVASVPDQETQDYFEANFTYDQYWMALIGMTAESFPRQWAWLDGSEFTYWKNEVELPREVIPMLGFGAAYYTHQGPTRMNWKVIDRRGVEWNRIGYAFVLALPGEWTAEHLNQIRVSDEMKTYILANDKGTFQYNAFLNPYWSPDLNNWMRVVASTNDDNYVSMKYNFWGTDSIPLIDYMIDDFNDDFTTSHITYGTPPARGYDSTYPFADTVTINGQDIITVPEVGGGPATFTITFNRDMDTDIHPFVTFGPTPPYTDFQVKHDSVWIEPGEGGWLDARTWQGGFWVVPVTGDGYHCMRISGAVAADDPWLVTGYDVGRFRFEVKTMGILAMTLHATGGEGRIDLNWLQDDFDMLAGYNVYRSTAAEGTYERINNTIIPVGTESFTDYDVMPAVPLYYKFTVLQTDFTESGFSNIAPAAPTDTIMPEIVHTPTYQAIGGSNLRLTATATDNVMIQMVSLYYRLSGDTEYQVLAMLNTSEDLWTANIPGSAIQSPGVEYYITASDGISTVYSGTPALPHTVIVENRPSLNMVTPNSGQTDGGTLVTLSGNMFQDGATVWFGLQQATDVQFLSQSQIRCVTPSHYPAIVDVKVQNPDLTESVRVNGFTYHDEDVILSLPDQTSDYGTMVDIPLAISDVQGLIAASITIEYDPAVLGLNQVTAGGLLTGWSFVPNTTTTGVVQLSTAGATSIDGTGSLAVLQFEILASPPALSALTISASSLNDGTISHVVDNGQLVVNGFFGLSGSVSYYSDSAPISDVKMTLSGNGPPAFTTTDSSGSFEILDIPVGSYRLTPEKISDVNEITAYDASLVLQADAGLISLSDDQKLAADVNKNGIISAMDASYILQKAVDLIPLPFPGNQQIWTFIPSEREYALLNSDLGGQDFTALLIGDVSGNWTGSKKSLNKLLSGVGLGNKVMIPSVVLLPHEKLAIPLLLSLEEGSQVTSIDLEINYNSQVMDVNSIVVSELVLLNNMSIASNSEIPGVIKIALAGTIPMSHDGTIVTMVFDSVSIACAAEQVSLSKVSLNEGSVEVLNVNGSISISPYRTDFSRDCQVDITDLLMMAEQWLRVPANPLMDVTGDGSVNMLDLARIAEQWML